MPAFGAVGQLPLAALPPAPVPVSTGIKLGGFRSSATNGCQCCAPPSACQNCALPNTDLTLNYTNFGVFQCGGFGIIEWLCGPKTGEITLSRNLIALQSWTGTIEVPSIHGGVCQWLIQLACIGPVPPTVFVAVGNQTQFEGNRNNATSFTCGENPMFSWIVVPEQPNVCGPGATVPATTITITT